MYRRSLAFRLLLSLLLLLNGIGTAAASVRMALPVMADVAVDAAAVAVDVQPPCHAAAMGDVSHALPMPAAVEHAGIDRSAQGHGDCCAAGNCDASSCDCPCVMVAAVLPQALPLAAAPMVLPPPLLRVAPQPSPPRRAPDRPPIA